MSARKHQKQNNSDRTRREKLKKPSLKTRGIHGEGIKNPSPKGNNRTRQEPRIR